MIIAIDGAVATGKSTIAKKLAAALGFSFFDTGSMYRTVTYAFLKHRVNYFNLDQVKKFLDNLEFEFDSFLGDADKRIIFEGEDITDKIRQKEVTSAVSEVAAIEPIRKKLVTIQRSLAKGKNAVFEGRDIGTEVFPDAALKVFLTGREEVRARRRFEELKAKYPDKVRELTLEECLLDIRKRDEQDLSRQVSPLRAAEDARILDTSDLTLDEIVERIRSWV